MNRIFILLMLIFFIACTKDRNFVPVNNSSNPSDPSNPSNPGTTEVVLKINEFMASNSTTIQNPDTADFSDWFEIYNPTNSEIDLAGYFITDDSLQPTKCQIPSGNSATKIPAKGFKIIWCDNSPHFGPLHVKIGLKSTGEAIGIVRPDSTFMDFYKFGVQATDTSMGRTPNGSDIWTIQTISTPGTSNN